jgi:predicted DNA-binding protein (MmcQ/YjbR family)
MKNLEQELMAGRFPDFAKLADFGFEKRNDQYEYLCEIGGGSFQAAVTVSEKGVVSGKVVDIFTDEEYVQVRTAGHRGGYAAKIRQEYLQLLEEIAAECFFEIPFLLPQSYRIACLIERNYGQKGTYPFEKKPACCAFGTANEKYYALIHPASENGADSGEGMTEVLEFRCGNEESEELIQKDGFVRASQIKKGGIGIRMEENLSDEEIMSYVEKSRRLAEGRTRVSSIRREWVYPANPKYFDLDHGFSVSDQLYWKQSSKVRVGDLVYLYYGMPFGELRWLCEVTEADIPNTGPDDGLIRMETLMRIRRLKFFDGHLLNRNLLKKYGFTNFRGPRYMSQELKEKIIELYGPIDPDDSMNP